MSFFSSLFVFNVSNNHTHEQIVSDRIINTVKEEKALNLHDELRTENTLRVKWNYALTSANRWKLFNKQID